MDILREFIDHRQPSTDFKWIKSSKRNPKFMLSGYFSKIRHKILCNVPGRSASVVEITALRGDS